MYAHTSFFVAVADADARGVLAALGHYMTACMYVLCTSYEVRRYEYGAARGMWDAPGEKCACECEKSWCRVANCKGGVCVCGAN